MPGIEQLKGKELLDTLEALRTILHPTVRSLLESYTIDMVMPIPGIISFLLIEKPKQEIEPSTVISRIRDLMEGYIDYEEPISLPQGISYPPKLSTKRRPRKILP